LDSIRTAKEATTASLGAAYNNFTPKPIKFALDKSAEFIGAGLDKLGERYGAGWKKAILTAAAISVPFALPPTLVAAEAARALGYAGKQAVAAAPVPTVEPQLLKTASQVEQAAKSQRIPLPVVPAVDIAGLAKASSDVQQAIKATPVTLPITPALSGNAGSVVINAADEMRLAIEKAAGFASIRPFEGLIRQAAQFRESLGLLGTEEKVVHDGLTQLLASLAAAKQNPFSPAAKSLEAIGLQASTLANLRIDQSLQQIFDGLRKIDDVRLREDVAQKLLGAGFSELEATLGKVGGLKLPEVKLALNVRDAAEKAVRDLKDVFGGALDKLFSGDISGAIGDVIKGTLAFAKGLAKDALGQIGKDAAAAFATGGLPAALEAGAAGASQAVAGLSAGLTALGASIPVIGQIALAVLAVAAAATLLNNYVQSAFANTLGLLKQAQALGVAGQRSLEVGHAFARASADINEVGPSLNRFAKFLGDVKLDPNGAQAQSLRRLGLDAEQLARTPLPEALGQVGDALNGLGDRALQAHFANEIFGRGWADLQGVFRRGSAGFQEAAAEYRRFAGVISATDAERVKSAARAGQIAAAQRAAVSQGVQVRTAVAFAPVIENSGKLSQAFNEAYRLGGTVIGDLLSGLGRTISVVSELFAVVAIGVRGWTAFYQTLYAVGKAIFLLLPSMVHVVKLLGAIADTDAFKDFTALLRLVGDAISNIADEVSGFFDSLAGKIPGIVSEIATVIPGLKEIGGAIKAVFDDISKPRGESQFWNGLIATTPAFAALEIARQRRLQQEPAATNAAAISTRLPPDLFRNTTLRRPDRLAERLSQTPLIEPVREQADSALAVAKQLEALAEQIQLTTQLRSEAERLGLVRVNATQQELEAVKDLVEFQLRNAAAIGATAGAAERLQAFARARAIAQPTVEAQNTTAEFRRQADELQRSTELMAILIGQGLSFEQIQRRLEQQKQVDSLVRRNAPQAEIVQLREAFRVANPAAELNAATQEATRQVASLQATTRRLQIVVDLRREALAAGENLADVENRINAEADRRLLIERGIADEVDRQLQAAQRGAQADEERIRLLGEANRIIQANRQADAGAAFDDQLKKIEELVQLGELQRSQADLAIGRHFLDFERTLGQQPGLPTQVLSSQTVEGLRSAAAQRAGLNSPTDPQERVVQAMERSRQTQEQMAAYLRELAVNARRRRTEETVAGGDF
ncbi:MAG: hypothetical protein K1X74_22975, partial [Pirellulales bacterium]|nr:hypothetical protein [Pirellulales bacterium]